MHDSNCVELDENEVVDVSEVHNQVEQAIDDALGSFFERTQEIDDLPGKTQYNIKGTIQII